MALLRPVARSAVSRISAYLQRRGNATRRVSFHGPACLPSLAWHSNAAQCEELIHNRRSFYLTFLFRSFDPIVWKNSLSSSQPKKRDASAVLTRAVTLVTEAMRHPAHTIAAHEAMIDFVGRAQAYSELAKELGEDVCKPHPIFFIPSFSLPEHLSTKPYCPFSLPQNTHHQAGECLSIISFSALARLNKSSAYASPPSVDKPPVSPSRHSHPSL